MDSKPEGEKKKKKQSRKRSRKPSEKKKKRKSKKRPREEFEETSPESRESSSKHSMTEEEEEEKDVFSSNASPPKRTSPVKKIIFDSSVISEFLNEDALLVDKSTYIAKLASSTCKSFFVARPRKFGKTLFLRFLREFFLGNRAIFESLGLAICKDPSVKWKRYPVIHLDMSLVTGVTNVAKFESSLKDLVLETASDLDIRLNDDPDLTAVTLFARLIKRAYQKEKLRVVILIDEYDAPFLNNPSLGDECERLLSSFYGVMKSTAEFLRFRYVTGITHFCLPDCGSGLNELDDLDDDPDFNYSALFGYTLSEIVQFCSAEVDAATQREGLTQNEEELASLLKYYDGYNWDKEGRSAYQVYNPYSVNSFLAKKKIASYWGVRGIPSWLKGTLVKYDYVTLSLHLESSMSSRPTSLTEICGENPSSEVIPYVLWESGILAKTSTGGYSFVNDEARDAFKTIVLNHCPRPSTTSDFSPHLNSIKQRFACDDIKGVFDDLEKIFNSFPDVVRNRSQSQKNEYPYHLSIYVIFLMQADVKVGTPETSAGGGRIDLYVATKSTIFVIEFKVNRSVKEALKQIKDNEYSRWGEVYLSSGQFYHHIKKAVGVNFGIKDHGLEVETGVEDLQITI